MEIKNKELSHESALVVYIYIYIHILIRNNCTDGKSLSAKTYYNYYKKWIESTV